MPPPRMLASLSHDVVGHLDQAHRAARGSKPYRSGVKP
jgi:hypothetical protein